MPAWLTNAAQSIQPSSKLKCDNTTSRRAIKTILHKHSVKIREHVKFQKNLIGKVRGNFLQISIDNREAARSIKNEPMYSKIHHKIFTCNCENNNECDFEKSEMDLKTTKKDFNSNRNELVKIRDVEKEEILAIRNRFPTKVPVIVRRYPRESNLPQLDKSKYLVPQEITMSQFQTIIRNRMHMHPNQAMYLLVNERSMLSLSLTLAEVYKEYALPDGYLYVTYASQEVFGDSPSYREDYRKAFDQERLKKNMT